MPQLRISSSEFPRLDQLSRAYKALPTATARHRARATLGLQMIRAVRADRRVARDTGRFQQGFTARVLGVQIVLINRMSYAPYPEAGYPARRTRHSVRKAIRRAVPTIVRNTKAKHPVPRGALKQAGRRRVRDPFAYRPNRTFG